MSSTKFFRVPWATSGDKAAIPDTVQPSGAVSYPQGFGPDYERDPLTDPLAKRVPRDESNQLYYDVTENLRAWQLNGLPEWVTSAQNGGTPVSYEINAMVRHNQSGTFLAYQSLVATNTAEPGTDATKWAVMDPFSYAAQEATLAEALAGSSGTRVITPRRLASSVQQGVWTYAMAGGAANALTATLTPAPASLTVGMIVNIKISAINTSTTPTFNLNGFGAAVILSNDGAPIPTSAFVPGLIATLSWDGANWRLISLTTSQTPPRNTVTYTAPGTVNFTVPAGVYKVFARVWGGGGGGGGSGATANAGGGGGGGGYAEGWFDVTPGQVIPITVGAAGSPGAASNSGNAGGGGTSSFGGALSATGGSGGANGSAAGGAPGNGAGGSFSRSGGSGYAGGYFAGNTSFPFGGAGAPSYGQSIILPNFAGGSVSGFGFGTGGSGATGAGGSAGSLGAAGAVILQY